MYLAFFSPLYNIRRFEGIASTLDSTRSRLTLGEYDDSVLSNWTRAVATHLVKSRDV